jgi:hypothetical protein
VSESIDDLSAALLERVEAIDGEGKVAHLDSLIAALATRRAELQADWDAFEAVVEPLIELLGNEADRIRREGTESLEALAALTPPLLDGTAEVVEDLRAAGTAVLTLASLAHELNPAMVEGVRTSVIEPAREAVNEAEAVGRSVQAALDSVLVLVGDAFLESSRDSRQQATLNGDVLKVVGESVNLAMAADFEEWSGRMEDIVEVVETNGTLRTVAHAQVATDAAMADCRTAQLEPSRRLTATIVSAEEMVQGVVDNFVFLETTLRERAPELEAASGDCLAALATSREHLRAIRELLENRGFKATA